MTIPMTIFLFTYFSARSCSSSDSKDQNMNIILRDPSGIIKTPGYPSNYPPVLITQCIWKIIAPKGQVIRLDFSSFRMGQYYCVHVQDGINKKDPLEIMSECGSDPSFTVYSTGRELSVYVKEHFSGNTGPGFIANYSTVSAGEKISLDQAAMIRLVRPGLFIMRYM